MKYTDVHENSYICVHTHDLYSTNTLQNCMKGLCLSKKLEYLYSKCTENV